MKKALQVCLHSINKKVGAATLAVATFGLGAGLAAAQAATDLDITTASDSMKTKAAAAIIGLGLAAYTVNALLFAYRKGGKVINKS